MAENRAVRGVPIPSLGQIVLVGAALVAAWIVYSNHGGQHAGSDEAVAENPLGSQHALETWLAGAEDPVPRLLPALDSQDARERKLAAYGLGRVGPAAVLALEKLRERLVDVNARVRESAVVALICISPDKESAAAIAPLMADSEAAVRQSAIAALFEIGPDAVASLCAMLHSDLPEARFDILRAVRRLDARNYNKLGSARGKIIDALVDACHDRDPKVRYEAITAAAEWHCASPSQVRELFQDLERARIGLLAIPSLSDDGAQLLPDILALLDDDTPLPHVSTMIRGVMPGPSSPDRFHAVLSTLSLMKTAARPAADRLVEIAGQRSGDQRLGIAKTLHDIGAEENAVAGLLTPLLMDRDLSWSAGRLLVELFPHEARRQVALLLPRLGTNETSIDHAVLFALDALGDQAQEAVPAVVPLLQNYDAWSIVKVAAHMLGEARIGSADVVAGLAQGAGDGSLPDDSRVACINALARIGTPARSIVPQLLQLVGALEPAVLRPVSAQSLGKDSRALAIRQAESKRAESRMEMQAAIIRALGRLGGEDVMLVKVLRSRLESDSLDIRAAATDALGRISRHSAETLADLLRRLRDDSAGVRMVAALAIGRIAMNLTPEEQKDAVPPLINALADEQNIDVRQAAAMALGKIGPAARRALPALRELQAPQATNGMNVRSWSPASRQQYLMTLDFYDDFKRMSVQESARAAIEQIERAPSEK